ncbi:hypothetical protein WDV93_01390 [Pantoea ananatis]
MVASDDIINAIEAGADLDVSGGSTQLAEGTVVTVTLNNVGYTGTVDAAGNWTVSVPSSALSGLPSGSQQTFVITANDVAGNTALTKPQCRD